MSQENVEIVRAGIEAYNRRDLGGMLEHASPDLVWDMSRAIGPDRGVFGLAEFRSWVEDLWAAFAAIRLEAHEYIEVGEQVVVPVTAHGRGRDGIEAPPTPRTSTRSATVR